MIPSHLKKSKLVFHGARIDIRQIRHRTSDGQTYQKDVIVHPGSVVILPMLDSQTVVLIRNERPAVGDTLWEIPAGTLEPPGEDPDKCAARELIEETGYKARWMKKLGEFYSSPGFMTELMRVYVATGLTVVGQDLDDSERITVHPTPWRQAMKMIRTGEIRDGKTVATMLMYRSAK